MANTIQQYRFYEKNSSKNYGINDVKDLVTGDFLKEKIPIIQLGIQALAGTRFYLNDSTQPIIIGDNGIFELELDGVKAQVDAKNDKISDLQRQLSMADLKASQIEQNTFIANGFANEVDQLYNRLSNCPVPSTPVYGRTPIFTCNNNGCGCNGNANLF